MWTIATKEVIIVIGQSLKQIGGDRFMISVFESDIGRIREENQDCCWAFSLNDTMFGVVADGMGGHRGGSAASEIAVENVKKIIEQEYKENMTQGALVSLLSSCCTSANNEILNRAQKEKELDGMGTTMVLAAVRKNRVTILNVGDSRAYLVQGDELKQITKDQSFVQLLVDRGEISESEAQNHPQKNVIMQAVGVSDRISPDIYELDYNGECLILCSDGLSNKLSAQDIVKVVNDETKSANEKLEALIHIANEAGGEDNISVVLIMDK